jgi:D-serine deaminase-like pyridoxal phosphate-dependent protein
VEIDVGFRRCGIANEDDVLTLAQKIDRLPNLQFNGLMFFPGHFQVPEQERAAMRVGVNDFLSRLQTKLQQSSLPPATVSGGSTPTALESHLFVGVNETRPGMYIFNDRTMVGIGVAKEEDCALSVVTTVVSTSVSGRAIIDAGSKTLSSDRYPTGNGKGFGLIKSDPEVELEQLSEEHGHLNISRSTHEYRVGQRLAVIPNHVCSTINMHNQIYGARGDQVETVWEVAGRGKVQ